MTSLPRKRMQADRVEHFVGLFVEVRNHHDDAAAAEVLRQLAQRRPEAAGAPGLHAIERVQHDVDVLGRRRHVIDDLLVEGHEADAIALLAHQVGQAGRPASSRNPASLMRAPNAIDFETSSSTLKFEFESASNSLM